MESLPDPRTPEALLTPSGRGVYLARAFMDEFYVQAGSANGTTVTLIKYIRDDGPRPALGLALAS
jgi:anti-sigma regulatory factor (Ser/Thr protein kinase)